MSDFVNFVCWSDAAVLASAPRDAASLLPGHFRAVHHPLRARRGRIELGREPEGLLVEEHEVVDALRSAIGPDGYRLIPIVGGSGTGKSHLVRWVYEQTRDSSEWETRYLPKNQTSIRRVVDLVITGMHGPTIDAAREALELAPAHSESDETLGQRLLDELALIVADKPTGQTDPDRHDAQLRDKLRATLPDIFHDPIVRQRFTSPGAVIPRLIGLAQSGRQDDDGLDDDAVHIAGSDLPLTFDDIGDVTPRARNTLLSMSNIPDMRRVALEIINEALPQAVKRVFLSNSIDLVAVFRDIRREIRKQGKELVLFIEDLTVLHGVEREFLDAIVESASSAGGELCNLRVLFAITRGHFDNLDTVRTRCDDAYWLDSTYGTDGIEPDEVLSFLGRYLNACRIDPQKLEADWARHTDAVPLENACHTCDHHETCHAGFGASSEGYGLYPFNQVAVDRLVDCLSTLRFDPRQVVKMMIEKLLPLSMVELESASFPSEELLTEFDSSSVPVRPEIVERLRSEYGGEAERRATLLRYWAKDRLDIESMVLEAFGMAPSPSKPEMGRKRRNAVQNRVSEQPTNRSRSEKPTIVAFEERLKPNRQRAFRELEAWTGQQKDLSLRVTNDLKKFIHRAVLDTIDLDETPLHLGGELVDRHFKPDRAIHIEGTLTAQGDPAEAIIKVRRDAATAVAISGLIVHGAGLQADDPYDDERRRALAQHLEEWTESTISALYSIAALESSVAVEGLVVASLVLGTCAGAQRPSDYLSLMFCKPMEFTDRDHRSPEWAEAVAKAEEEFLRLRPMAEAYFGESRGTTGAVRALRADQMLPHVQKVVERLDSEDMASPDAAVVRFLRTVSRAVEVEWQRLCDDVKGAAPMLEGGQTFEQQAEAVKELHAAALRAGRFEDLDTLADIGTLDAGSDRVLRSLRDTTKAVNAECTFTKRIQILSGEKPRDVSVAHQFVKRAIGMMDTIERNLSARSTEAGASDGLVTTVAAIEQELTSLLNAASDVTR